MCVQKIILELIKIGSSNKIGGDYFDRRKDKGISSKNIRSSLKNIELFSKF